MTNTGSSIIITIIFMIQLVFKASRGLRRPLGVMLQMESLRRAELMEAACSSSHLRLIEQIKLDSEPCSRGANALANISLRRKRSHPHVDS